MTTNDDGPDLLDPTQAHELAGDLLRQLEAHVHDEQAVTATLRHWFDVLGAQRLSLVCIVAVRRTFGECLTRTPIENVGPGAVAYVERTPA